VQEQARLVASLILGCAQEMSVTRRYLVTSANDYGWRPALLRQIYEVRDACEALGRAVRQLHESQLTERAKEIE
jgi:hypothetical protein